MAFVVDVASTNEKTIPSHVLGHVPNHVLGHLIPIHVLDLKGVRGEVRQQISKGGRGLPLTLGGVFPAASARGVVDSLQALEAPLRLLLASVPLPHCL